MEPTKTLEKKPKLVKKTIFSRGGRVVISKKFSNGEVSIYGRGFNIDKGEAILFLTGKQQIDWTEKTYYSKK